jgi:hypothetical protein
MRRDPAMRASPEPGGTLTVHANQSAPAARRRLLSVLTGALLAVCALVPIGLGAIASISAAHDGGYAAPGNAAHRSDGHTAVSEPRDRGGATHPLSGADPAHISGPAASGGLALTAMNAGRSRSLGQLVASVAAVPSPPWTTATLPVVAVATLVGATMLVLWPWARRGSSVTPVTAVIAANDTSGR